MSKENWGEQLPPIKERFSTVLDLSKQLGGIDNIPEDMLAQHGYRRIELGHILPIEIDAVSVDEKWEQKRANTPFEKISLSVPTIQETGASSITRAALRSELRKRFGDDNANDSFAYIERTDWLSDNQLGFFWHDFSAYIDTKSDIPEGIKEEFKDSPRWFMREWAEIVEHEFIYDSDPKYVNALHNGLHDADSLMIQHDIFDGDVRLNAEQANSLSETLDRYKASLADIPRLEATFEKLMSENYQFTRRGDEEFDEFTNYVSSLGLQSDFSILQYYFGDYLQSKGLNDIATSLQQAETAKEAAQALETSDNFITSLKEAEHQLRVNRPNGDNEDALQEHNEKLQELKNKLRTTKDLVDGMREFFITPQLYGEYMRRSINKIQKQLIVKPGAKSIELTLDPLYDAEKDANPGQMSGDCTEGRPLPFKEATVPVYNVKAYEKGRHFGNMYLLATKAADQKLVWHFEAIQLPNQRIDWVKFPAHLVQALAAAAEVKGVDYITINHSEALVSNYDYIGDSFTKFVKGSGDKRLEIKRPGNPKPDEYSNWQGEEEVSILWQNPGKSSSIS